jgi:Domain of unknown function (DUF4126)
VPCRYRHAPAGYRPASAATSLFLDIGQGAGLSGASGIRPFLPPLLAGALARGDIGLDFDGTDWAFLESPGFLLAVFALAVLWYGLERSGPNQLAQRAAAVLGLALGGLLFAGSLAEGGHEGWPGIVAGVACAALAWLSVGGLLSRAGERLRRGGGGEGLLGLYAELAALLLAGLAILLPPVSFLALIAFAVLLARSPGEDERKYAGLRILR